MGGVNKKKKEIVNIINVKHVIRFGPFVIIALLHGSIQHCEYTSLQNI